jgi:gliding motility-associated transport system permease protein/gliding motility-associatede transport system auxiliary component
VIWSVAKKELRGYFNSAVAVIFLATFLTFTLYTFFWTEKFFARGLADLRPLFQWMPKLLIIVVSALAMRQWADERRAGTLEILLTLPVPRWKLVVGKFVAGMILLAIALGLTLELPITIAKLGNLDLGPVIGGYFAALLLCAAYLAIGMCVSAATDNQIVAFVGTAFVCGLIYLVGGDGTNALGRQLGTGARFESIARGVLDLRDLAYYGSIVAVGIAVNVLLLDRLTWSRGPRTRNRRLGALLATGLIAANALALNFWLAPIGRARIDLTQNGAYSLSDSTAHILHGLDERLLIRGYFSEKTHPKLAPLIPQIRDLLEEYRIVGGRKVRVEIVDPTDDDDAMRDAKERFDINPSSFHFSTSTEDTDVNAYFAVAIEYGDQHAVLDYRDLIAMRATANDDVEVTLKSPEYTLTKTIKKTVAGFSSVDALFGSMPGGVTLTAYVTPNDLPKQWKDGPAHLQKVVDELKKQSGGKLSFQTIEPKTEDEMRDLLQRFGLAPLGQDLLSGRFYYFGLLMQVGNRIVVIAPGADVSEPALKKSLTDGLKRAAPGFTRVVGLWSQQAPPPMMLGEGMPPRQLPPPQSFKTLSASLEGNYEVRDVTLGTPIPDDVDVLLLAGPANFDAKAARTVDQFVMRGGALVVLAGRYRLSLMGGLGIEKVTTGLEAELAKWGITLGDEMVMDTKSDAFPVRTNHDVGNGMVIPEVNPLPYPFFVKLEGKQLSSDSLITTGLPGAVVHWGSPVKAEAKAGSDSHEVEKLLESSDSSWLTTTTSIQPDPRKYPKTGFPEPDGKTGSHVLAVSITGGFASGIAKPTSGEKAEPTLEHSPPDTRIVVFGSSAFVSDDVLGLAQELRSQLALSNVNLVHNAIDWALADTDLLEIRSHNAAQRALLVDADSRETYRDVDIIVAFVVLGAVIAFAWVRRRSIAPVVPREEG